MIPLLVLLILAGLGAHVLLDFDPVHVLIVCAVVGVLYHLAIALIDWYFRRNQ